MELLNDLIKEPFGAAAARELCRMVGLFQPGRLYRRIEISDALRKEFVRYGGASGTTNAAVATVLKKWLLTHASPFRKEMRGRYRFLGLEADTKQYPAASPGGFAVRDAPLEHRAIPGARNWRRPLRGVRLVYARAHGEQRRSMADTDSAGPESKDSMANCASFRKCLPERPLLSAETGLRRRGRGAPQEEPLARMVH